MSDGISRYPGFREESVLYWCMRLKLCIISLLEVTGGFAFPVQGSVGECLSRLSQTSIPGAPPSQSKR